MTTFPSDIKFRAEKLESVFTTSVSRTGGGQRRAAKRPAHYWRLELETQLLSPADARRVYAFAIAQEGRFNVFSVPSQVFKQPQGAGGGTPVLNGAASAGQNTVLTSGWPNSQTVLKAGDLVQFGDHPKVYMIAADAVSNGSGQAGLVIRPQLVKAFDSATPVKWQNVTFTMAFEEDSFVLEKDYNSDFAILSLKLEEVWNA